MKGLSWWYRLGLFGAALAALFFYHSPQMVYSAEEGSSQAAPEHVSGRYRHAARLLEVEPARAYQIAHDIKDELEDFGELEDRRLLLMARAAQGAGMVDEALAALLAFARVAPRPLDALYAHIERGELLLLQGQLDEVQGAINAAEQAQKKIAERSGEVRYFVARRWRLVHDLALARAYSADILATTGDKNSNAQHLSRAEKAARTLLVEFPTERATLRPGLVQAESDLNRAQLFSRARHLYAHWSYEEARRIFEGFRRDAARAGSAKWYLAQIALNKLRDRPEEAEALFKELAESGPNREDSLFQVARAQMRQERYTDAQETLDLYRERFPGGKYTETIFYYRGWLPYDHGQNDEAIEGFKRYVARYGKRGRNASYVHGFLAWSYMRLGRWEEAIKAWEELRYFGNMLVWGKALYWQAYAHLKLDDKDAAIERLDALREAYPVTYYGMLGEQLRARILGRDPRASKVWWPQVSDESAGREDQFKTVDDFELERLSPENRRIWERAQGLVALGERFEARREVQKIYDKLLEAVPAQEKNAWVYALGEYIEDYHPMWRIVSGGSIAAHPRPPEPGSLEAAMAYPRAYREVVESVAAEFELPPELIWAIMRQESRYRPAQISYTDAVGALQMIPRTARKVARDLGIEYNPRTFPIPAVGFRYSGYYLRKLLDTFSGLMVPMATSYNSGPSVVARWFRESPEADFDWLVEEFAYNEGRNYGRKVAEHLLRYLYLYEPDAARRGEVLDQLFPLSRDIELADDVGY